MQVETISQACVTSMRSSVLPYCQQRLVIMTGLLIHSLSCQNIDKWVKSTAQSAWKCIRLQRGKVCGTFPMCHVLIGPGMWLFPEAFCSMRNCASNWHRLFMVEAFLLLRRADNLQLEDWVSVSVRRWMVGCVSSYCSSPKGFPVSSPALGITHKYQYIKTHTRI